MQKQRLLAVLIVLLLSACGQKGALKLVDVPTSEQSTNSPQKAQSNLPKQQKIKESEDPSEKKEQQQ